MRQAKDAVLAKTGEISIIRSNQAKVSKEYERKMEELQNQQVKENEKHKLELENARKEREKLLTHNQFLDHEVNDQTWRVKQAQKGKDKAANPQDGINTTPKKRRDMPLGDGFDDHEIVVVSPSKNAARIKGSTPKLGAKRKRDVLADSPAKELQLSQGPDGLGQDLSDLIPIKSFMQAAPVTTENDGDRFEVSCLHESPS